MLFKHLSTSKSPTPQILYYPSPTLITIYTRSTSTMSNTGKSTATASNKKQEPIVSDPATRLPLPSEINERKVLIARIKLYVGYVLATDGEYVEVARHGSTTLFICSALLGQARAIDFRDPEVFHSMSRHAETSPNEQAFAEPSLENGPFKAIFSTTGLAPPGGDQLLM